MADTFTEFARVAEPRLRLALGAAFGFDVAQEATAEAMAFAWEHWDRVAKSANPLGYVFGVGRKRRDGACADPGSHICHRSAPSRSHGSNPACPERLVCCRSVSGR